jgi:hypothetical protein
MLWSKLTGPYNPANEAISTSSGSDKLPAVPGAPGSTKSAEMRKPPATHFDVATIRFSFSVKDSQKRIPVVLRLRLVTGLIDVPKESREPNEETYADQILERFDIAVEINHRIQLLDLSDRARDLIYQVLHLFLLSSVSFQPHRRCFASATGRRRNPPMRPLIKPTSIMMAGAA